MYKNQLQELAQRSCFNLPSYSCIREGPDHAPRFKATVNFNGETFESPTFCSTLRQAEHAAAEVALSTLAKRGPSRALAARVLDETGVYKNLLQETAHRAGLKLPVYTTVRSGPGHVPIFSCTVELAGMAFTGEPARTKKQAQKNAAMAAWSALKKLSQSRTPSLGSLSLESKGSEEQEQVTIARVLASLRPSESSKFPENHHRNGQRGSIPISQTTPGLYPMQCSSWQYSSFSPEITMYQIWQREQLLQQQNHMLALTVPAVTTSTPQIYPVVHSMLPQNQCLYFPGRELESIPTGPKITIGTSGSPFCISNNLVSSSVRGKSTVTIQEIPEEKPEASSKYTSSGVPEASVVGNNSAAEPQIPETVGEDDKQSLGGLERKIRNIHLEGYQTGQFESPSHRHMDSGSKPIEFQLQNPCSYSSRPNLRPQTPLRASSHCIFGPPFSAVAPVRIRTIGSYPPLGVRPQSLSSPGAASPRMRTGVPSCTTRPPERLDLERIPPAFIAPAVRIRSVVPVCSAPPVRKMPSSQDDRVLQSRERMI